MLISQNKSEKCFFENLPYNVDGEGPDQNFWCVGDFLSKVSQKQFWLSETAKIDDFGPFFKNRCSKFLPTGKTMFFETSFFFRSRK